jgi:histidinol-phosphate aminotransferase
MHYRYDNVITLRTFSKVYGLAGVRIGYGFAHETLIRNVLKVKLPFEPSTLAQAAAIGALTDKEFVHRSLELNARALRRLTSGLQRMGLRIVPSDANFVMIVMEDDTQAIDVSEGLLRQGIVIRPLRAFGLSNCVRVSTGTDDQIEACLKAFESVLPTLAGPERETQSAP